MTRPNFQAVREQVVKVALEHPEKSPRELAWYVTDVEEYFISESSVYRILKAYDLVTSPVFQMITAGDRFEKPTGRVNEMWQTDFTQFKVVGWGWYYLCTVLDDYSRYILAWRLSTNMAAGDVDGMELHQTLVGFILAFFDKQLKGSENNYPETELERFPDIQQIDVGHIKDWATNR